jgi:hypothetical protein
MNVWRLLAKILEGSQSPFTGLDLVKKKQGFSAFNVFVYQTSYERQNPVRGNIVLKKRRRPPVVLKIDVDKVFIFGFAKLVDEVGFANLPRSVHDEGVPFFFGLPFFKGIQQVPLHGSILS